jgi:hypothetical protein
VFQIFHAPADDEQRINQEDFLPSKNSKSEANGFLHRVVGCWLLYVLFVLCDPDLLVRRYL